jgi:type VI secretion system protein ImpA
MSILDTANLLSPLDEAAPCGPDLEYDPAFLEMLATGEGKPEHQYGDTVIPAEPPDWPVLFEQARQLAQRTRDLRVAVWLVRSAAHVAGLPGAVDGLRVVRGLLEQHWDAVHPVLDASDNNDPTARLNALAPLAHFDGALADLRAAGLTSARGSLTVRDLEIAIGHADPLPGETGALEGTRVAFEQVGELAQAMLDGSEVVKAIAAAIDTHLSAADGPDFTALIKLMRVLSEAARRASGEAASADEASADSPGTEARRGGVPGAINSRDDAVSALERVCVWIEHNEPSNPAPLLIRRAQRLMRMNFLDIIRDIVPDGLDSVERLAGPGGT